MATSPSRRDFLTAAAIIGASLNDDLSSAFAADTPTTAPTVSSIPVIDTHIHLFDPTRPGGVPWPSPNNAALYKPSYPSRYRPIAEPLGIVGAIEVECSALLEDNQWVLDVAEKETIMVGTVGRLVPGTPEFKPNLERFHKNPLYRGIRYGLGRNGGKELDQPEFIDDLKALAAADLVMDTANPSVALLADVAKLSEKVPELRIVVDHLPQMVPPTDGADRASYEASMKAIKERPQIFVKVSEVLRKQPDGSIPTDLGFYCQRIDQVMETFGIDRVLYGSDWPNSDQWLPVPVGFKIVQEYFTAMGKEAAEKYFWRNSVKCYKWVKRTPAQSKLA